MYSNSHPARYLPAPPLTSPYIPSSYGDFSDYHHPVPGFLDPLCDLPAAAWSRANAAPREDWATLSHGFPGSSPDAGPASYESTEFTALHPAFGGGACAPLTRGPGDPFTHSVISRSYEWIRDSGLPESGHGAEHRTGPTAEGSQVSVSTLAQGDRYHSCTSINQTAFSTSPSISATEHRADAFSTLCPPPALQSTGQTRSPPSVLQRYRAPTDAFSTLCPPAALQSTGQTRSPPSVLQRYRAQGRRVLHPLSSSSATEHRADAFSTLCPPPALSTGQTRSPPSVLQRYRAQGRRVLHPLSSSATEHRADAFSTLCPPALQSTGQTRSPPSVLQRYRAQGRRVLHPLSSSATEHRADAFSTLCPPPALSTGQTRSPPSVLQRYRAQGRRVLHPLSSTSATEHRADAFSTLCPPALQSTGQTRSPPSVLQRYRAQGRRVLHPLSSSATEHRADAFSTLCPPPALQSTNRRCLHPLSAAADLRGVTVACTADSTGSVSMALPKQNWILVLQACSTGGRTRTTDKYRVVYSDRQRLELEKEFQHSRYITIQRKAQLSLELHLSERQVKIWFQNRRAKERKLTRRKQQASSQQTSSQQASSQQASSQQASSQQASSQKASSQQASSQQASGASPPPQEASLAPPPRTPPVPPVQW
ncbi:unnamed protein product [Arctogadus glacialis]